MSKLIGCLIGLFLGSSDENLLNCTLGFVIGNFLYISLIQMYPILNRETNKKFYIAKSIGFLAGVAIMYLVLVIESTLV